MTERDPIEALRSAWSELRAPAPDRDVATDALVDELRARWNELEVPAADPAAFRDALRRQRSVLRWRDRAVLAAAAALLVALVLVAREDEPLRPRTEEQLAVNLPPEVPIGPPADSRVRPMSPEVQARPLDDGRLELRHGRVRLVLGGHSRTTIESHDTTAQPAVNAEEDSK